MATLTVGRDFAAPADRLWAALVDWDAHRDWMLLTRASGGAAVGESVEAFTGVGRMGLLDTMTILVWEPPHRAVVRHTGRLIRGTGSFEVTELRPGRSRVVWSEWLDLPFGVLGRLGWRLLRPLVRLGVALSLRRLAPLVEDGR